MFGFHGKILRVDLTKARITEENIPEKIVRKYLGGVGIATKILIDEIKGGIDPLGPENKLIFMTGLLTGTPSPSAGRYSVVAKSPLTGIWGQANAAGFWGAAFKQTGYDGVVFEGTSPEPVYLVIEEDKAELRDAGHLWGKSVSETTKLINEELGEKFNVACIGIAGEKKVKYACVINDLHRAAGRCGMGAVAGSKRLKAIAVWGKKPVNIKNPRIFSEVAKKQYTLIDQSFTKVGLYSYGTNMVIDLTNVRGAFPTRNWQTGIFPNIREINSKALARKVFMKPKSCFACTMGCGRVSEIRKGKYKNHKGEGPEYETVGTLGGMCEIPDMEAITMGQYLCNDYGLDSISTGSTIAFAMECYEKGILTQSDSGGMEIKFGDPDVMIELIHKIAKREGIGDLLAEGTKRISEKLGKGSKKFAMNVKGLELPAYDSRAVQLTGLAYATANRGGDHITAYIQGPTLIDMPFLIVERSKVENPFVANPTEAKIVKDLEDTLTCFDAIGACKFMGLCIKLDEWIDLIIETMGWEDFNTNEFRKIGERIYNLARIFNIREGITRADDTLPPRLLEEPLPEGPAKGQVNELPKLLDAYYEFRGWDKETGKPTPEKLKELKLEEYIPMVWRD